MWTDLPCFIMLCITGANRFPKLNFDRANVEL